MKTTVKVLIAGAVTAMAATFSTGASAASILDLHEQHKAQILGFLFGGNQPGVQGTINIGPAYQAPPVYQAPAYGGHHGYRGQRGYERRDGYRHDGYRDDRGHRGGRGFNR